jgi:hypothetical protein
MHDAALARRNSTVFVSEGKAPPGGGTKADYLVSAPYVE